LACHRLTSIHTYILGLSDCNIEYVFIFQENKVAELEGDFEQNQSDLKLAFKRIADLQAALEEGLDSDDDFSDR
jgi:hypothetical protein